MWNCQGTGYCLYLSGADNNTIIGGVINKSIYDLIYLDTNSDNNVFQDIQLINGGRNETV